MWRIRATDQHILVSDAEQVALADSVRVDVHEFRRQAESLLSTESRFPLRDIATLRTPIDLLPGWEDDWLLLSREQLRLLRLHALECSAQRICEMGLHAQAIDVILPVVAEEPFRESSQTILISAHLKSGNIVEACRQYERFSESLLLELGLRPSETLGRLVPRHASASHMG
jgi:DNA-binding SARP family transcriptional activator